MRTTKNWGFTNSRAELYMLAHAERTRKRLAKKDLLSEILAMEEGFSTNKN